MHAGAPVLVVTAISAIFIEEMSRLHAFSDEDGNDKIYWPRILDLYQNNSVVWTFWSSRPQFPRLLCMHDGVDHYIRRNRRLFFNRTYSIFNKTFKTYTYNMTAVLNTDKIMSVWGTGSPWMGTVEQLIFFDRENFCGVFHIKNGTSPLWCDLRVRREYPRYPEKCASFYSTREECYPGVMLYSENCKDWRLQSYSKAVVK